jgi:hypothetical protein
MVVINTGNLYNVHSHAAVYSDVYLVQSSAEQLEQRMQQVHRRLRLNTMNCNLTVETKSDSTAKWWFCCSFCNEGGTVLPKTTEITG